MKTLNDVINAVQHETQLSRSQMSLKIGKSRNYLSEVLRSGVSHEKEQEIINLLLEIVDDEVEFLRNQLEDKEQTIEAYRIKLKEIINENLDIVREKNCEISGLKREKLERHRELVKYENKCENAIDDLNEAIATKDLFIDGLENELAHVKNIHDESVGRNLELVECKIKQEKTIQSMKEVMRELGIDADKNHRKNRILTASIIGLVSIFSVYAFLR